MQTSFPKLILALTIASILSACGSSSSDTPVAATPAPASTATLATMATFEVTLQNLTAGQPMSKMVAIAHTDGFSVFQLGQPASVELEHIAEGGDGSFLAALAKDSKSVLAGVVADSGLPPGPNSKTTVTLTVPVSSLANTQLSTAAMLGNTNDGFTGVSAHSLANLAVGASMDIRLNGYDAGTELNTESKDSVPGPATANAGGKREGFNPTRDDIINTVHVHAGVVSMDDGLPSSALTQMQRWDNAVGLLTVKRVQ